MASRFRVTRGAYQGTTDDRADRWYVEDTRSRTVDRRGEGYRTRKEALEAAAEAESIAAAYDA